MVPALLVLVSTRRRVLLHDLFSVKMGRVYCLLRIVNMIESVCKRMNVRIEEWYENQINALMDPAYIDLKTVPQWSVTLLLLSVGQENA